MSLMSMTALELGRTIQAGEASAVEAVREALDRIQKLDRELNCCVTVDGEAALKKDRKSVV